MRILLANPRGFCAGVDRAVKIVDMALEVFGPPVYVRREIVHNSHVVGDLRAKGAVFVDELNDVPEGSVAILSAHGVSPTVFQEAKNRGLRLIDATCPLVTKVHLEVHRFVKLGYHIVLIGHKGHDEVIGTIGEAPAHITLVENEAQAATVQLPTHDKLMVLTQTTLGVDDTKIVIDALRRQFPYLELPPTDDVCYATQNRQDAVKEMAGRGMDLLLVVGSKNSSNAARLVEVGEARGVRGYLIDGANEIREEWLKGVECVAVTAGASTPEAVVQDVLTRLHRHEPSSVEYVTTAEESTVFQIPYDLRRAMEARETSKRQNAKTPKSEGSFAPAVLENAPPV
ncbi:MAG TPA: 4-hydroxy-3-methylbut-2-enyl diphosphate reductase [Phycisphaerae bacterium]|nr:4-hydroxy-3-methylbut-2-enyl diphosphate reductase [Phycisphaerae bacterium]